MLAPGIKDIPIDQKKGTSMSIEWWNLEDKRVQPLFKLSHVDKQNA